jgi:hypothetical protein
MKALATLAAALIAVPIAAASAQSLPGVSDRETEISHGGIMQWERGHGDVLFVRDEADHWYRLGLNKGCLKGSLQLRRMVFRNDGPGNRIDHFTKVDMPDDLRSCSIRSIRESLPPPQVNSRSPVTLD